MEEASLVEEALPLLVSANHSVYFSLDTSLCRLIFGIPIGSIGFSALLAPKVALYTALACRVHRPEYITNHYLHSLAFPPTHNLAATNAPDVPIPHASDGSETAVDTVSILLPNSTCTASSDYSQNGPDSEQKCASDPVVQAVVARLNAGLHQIPCFFLSV